MLALIQDALRESVSSLNSDYVRWFLADEDTSNALGFIGPILTRSKRNELRNRRPANTSRFSQR